MVALIPLAVRNFVPSCDVNQALTVSAKSMIMDAKSTVVKVKFHMLQGLRSDGLG